MKFEDATEGVIAAVMEALVDSGYRVLDPDGKDITDAVREGSKADLERMGF